MIFYCCLLVGNVQSPPRLVTWIGSPEMAPRCPTAVHIQLSGQWMLNSGWVVLPSQLLYCPSSHFPCLGYLQEVECRIKSSSWCTSKLGGWTRQVQLLSSAYKKGQPPPTEVLSFLWSFFSWFCFVDYIVICLRVIDMVSWLCLLPTMKVCPYFSSTSLLSTKEKLQYYLILQWVFCLY